jgi:lipoprotein signal peptidase
MGGISNSKIIMRKFVIILFIGIFIWLDMTSKIYFEEILHTKEYIPILWDLIGLRLTYNTGIAFSLPLRGVALSAITIIILMWLIYFFVSEEYKKNSRLLDIGYILIFSWALSHTYERILVWYVVDFIAVKYFAILNFADIFISVGAFFLLIAYGIHRRSRT